MTSCADPSLIRHFVHSWGKSPPVASKVKSVRDPSWPWRWICVSKSIWTFSPQKALQQRLTKLTSHCWTFNLFGDINDIKIIIWSVAFHPLKFQSHQLRSSKIQMPLCQGQGFVPWQKITANKNMDPGMGWATGPQQNELTKKKKKQHKTGTKRK